MKRCIFFSIVLVALLLGGCGSYEPAAPAAARPDAPPVVDREVESDDPTILRRPFTAEQIREEWIVGLTLDMHRVTPEEETRERWTVVGSGPVGVEIEFAQLDAEGRVASAGTSVTTWVELRNHASFPADRAYREEVTRDTQLGRLEGWLYTVEGPDEGTVTEYFFARSLPGAPVSARSVHGEDLLMELTQAARYRPE